ncbi:hypothetical protein AX17_004761 [Amanita inopinata Kibby_2008]|nr:hypothetical protein AX17_004761 [Amanita inopinata Kibby_2008]
MCSLKRLLTVACFATAVAGSALRIIPPAHQGKSVSNKDQTRHPETDTNKIVSTVHIVHQKGGADSNAHPNQAPLRTSVTAVDGRVEHQAVPRDDKEHSGHRKREDGINIEKRILPGYTQVFAGTGTGPDDRDAAIEGTAYLTYTVVPNSTYNVDACLEFCNRVPGCVFANLYYEVNNVLLDFVFSEHSNLKCAVYGDVHTAAEKTNKGGQQSYPPPAPLTYIQQSSGYALESLVEPPTPPGYQLIFGPTNGANNAPGYMGFAFITTYDVDACASLCNARNPDPVGGACQYFNIWRALVNGVPTTYTCAMYYLPNDQSTAVNYGQGDLQVTYSRGYRRISYLPDGGFEGYNACAVFCFTTTYTNWIGTSHPHGVLDATIFKYMPYAHSGHSVGILGSADYHDRLPGTLSPRKTLKTVPGKQYVIAFFHESTFSGQRGEAKAFVKVMWNGKAVATIRPGYQPWTYYAFTVTAVGHDWLAFHGGKAPSWSFIDDVYVFLA